MLSSVVAATALLWKNQNGLRKDQKQTHDLVNSRMTELLRLAREGALAKGIEIGERHEREE